MFNTCEYVMFSCAWNVKKTLTIVVKNTRRTGVLRTVVSKSGSRDTGEEKTYIVMKNDTRETRNDSGDIYTGYRSKEIDGEDKGYRSKVTDIEDTGHRSKVTNAEDTGYRSKVIDGEDTGHRSKLTAGEDTG